MSDTEDRIPEPTVTYLGEVQRLNLQPSDILVLTLDRKVSNDEAATICAMVKQHVPDHTVFLLQGGMSLSVLQAESDQAVVVHAEGLRTSAPPAQGKLLELLGDQGNRS